MFQLAGGAHRVEASSGGGPGWIFGVPALALDAFAVWLARAGRSAPAPAPRPPLPDGPGRPPKGPPAKRRRPPRPDIRADRVWGLDVEVAKRICELIGDIQEGITNPISTIPHGVFGLLCRVFYDAGDADVGAPSYYGLEVGWGVDGKPIFNLPPPPLAISFLGVTVDGP